MLATLGMSLPDDLNVSLKTNSPVYENLIFAKLQRPMSDVET
jgi:hypothetical protein